MTNGNILNQGPVARYICRACGYRWTRTMKGGPKLPAGIVLDLAFDVPMGPCCQPTEED